MFTRTDAEKIYRMKTIKVLDVTLNIKWGRPKNILPEDYDSSSGEMKLMKSGSVLK
jgi:hypothetical protein